MCAGGAGTCSPRGPRGAGPGLSGAGAGRCGGAGARGRGRAWAAAGRDTAGTRLAPDVTVTSEAPQAVSWSWASRADEAAGLKGVSCPRRADPTHRRQVLPCPLAPG
ncbi:uncharacterized protein LOC127481009 [Manacus candei]|uniref:uncharacterized protein LOC127481009 n=1 Tax=Manacus candei TaxID=415023 RepID=UPI0022270768|nr:uncharacterized protein LOC127481009 [Manacus candei]